MGDKTMYTLSCESTVDLTLDHLVQRNISAIAYTYTIDGKEYADDMRAGDGLKLFYSDLLAGKQPTTSLINEERYIDYFTPLLEKGDLLHVTFSSGLSQSANNAIAAAETLKKKFPNRKIYVADSLCASVGYGLFVDILADMRDSGTDIDALYDWTINNRRRLVHQFYSTTLTYFRRSGRVSGPAALIGNLLKLCPIMHLDGNGKIIAYSKDNVGGRSQNRRRRGLLRQTVDGALRLHPLRRENLRRTEESLPECRYTHIRYRTRDRLSLRTGHACDILPRRTTSLTIADTEWAVAISDSPLFF